jgi:PAT family beta-lactamase induction signal transducer AmpG
MARVPAPLLYLLIGSVRAAFTLLLLPLPHTAPVYVLAVLGECAAQTCAQVVQNAIIFRSIAPDDPLASSQFGLLQSALIVPYAYMQALDGYGYRLAGGVAGSLLMDAGVSLAACALMAMPVLRWLRDGRTEADPCATQPAGASPLWPEGYPAGSLWQLASGSRESGGLSVICTGRIRPSGA